MSQSRHKVKKITVETQPQKQFQSNRHQQSVWLPSADAILQKATLYSVDKLFGVWWSLCYGQSRWRSQAEGISADVWLSATFNGRTANNLMWRLWDGIFVECETAEWQPVVCSQYCAHITTLPHYVSDATLETLQFNNECFSSLMAPDCYCYTITVTFTDHLCKWSYSITLI